MSVELRNMENLKLLAEVVIDLKKHHFVGTDSRYFKITDLRNMFPEKTTVFDWIPKFFGATHNRNWLENVCKITMVGAGKSRELLISIKKENYEKKTPAYISKIMIPSYTRKIPKIEGLNLAIDCWKVKPIHALTPPNIEKELENEDAIVLARVISEFKSKSLKKTVNTWFSACSIAKPDLEPSTKKMRLEE
jgi:hypothetical protein